MGNNQCCQEPKNEQYTSQVVQHPVAVPPQQTNQKVIEQPEHHEQPQEHPNSNNPVVAPQIRQEEQNRSIVHAFSNQHPLQVEKPQSKIKQFEKDKHQSVQKQDQIIHIPQLNSLIKAKIQAENYFQDQFLENTSVRKFGQEIYQGYLDENNYPNGMGKMYKSDGSIYIGHFEHGRAEGEGVFLMSDGLTYKGSFHNNQAQGKGKYEYEGLVYDGHFSNNKFHGTGEEITAEYEYSGEYSEGNKTHGVFKWKDSQNKLYIYKGHFNSHNQFHGEGTLEQPNGVYTGQFVEGQKQGKGIYKYTSGLRYQGEYVKGKKSGMGTLYNYNNTIAYQGEFNNDMPHGKGVIYDAGGNKSQTLWVQGIDSSLL